MAKNSLIDKFFSHSLSYHLKRDQGTIAEKESEPKVLTFQTISVTDAQSALYIEEIFKIAEELHI